MISAGLVAQICVASMFLRPVSRHKDNNPNDFKKDRSYRKRPSFISQTKNVFKNGAFILHTINSVLLTLTVSVVVTHVMAFAESEGVNPQWSGALITTIGASNIGMYIWYV